MERAFIVRAIADRPVLLALDGSNLAERAIPVAAEIARLVERPTALLASLGVREPPQPRVLPLGVLTRAGGEAPLAFGSVDRPRQEGANVLDAVGGAALVGFPVTVRDSSHNLVGSYTTGSGGYVDLTSALTLGSTYSLLALDGTSGRAASARVAYTAALGSDESAWAQNRRAVTVVR